MKMLNSTIVLVALATGVYTAGIIGNSGSNCDGDAGHYDKASPGEGRCAKMDGRHSVYVDGNCRRPYNIQFYEDGGCRGLSSGVAYPNPNTCLNINTGGPVRSMFWVCP
ncbi:hypothetical protein NOR_07826 [Metarhizium rileyi]|uniref:Secreted protein n=1 Tax=Metarhizium rileyi (strain RCEF 4871) TaxID=1649241 RepID=A0A166XH86_METRR|nr:hypothetical protein NOR_07826 [Metarhizium rileyi RCEF 4871]